MRKIVLTIVASIILFSCENETTNETNVTAPSTYTFERNGVTTVDYNGQTTRIEMGEELVAALLDPTKTEVEIDGMFTNTGNYFTDTNLNSSSKSIRSKIAASADFFATNATDALAIRADFDSWIALQVSEVYPNWNTDASAGNAGQIQESGGGTVRYVNGKGLEYNQAVIKGLIGALMVDQMLNNYLSTSVLDEASNRADNDAEVLVSGTNYTNMEHKWDEAFGYLYGTDNATNPQLGADSYLNKYVARVENDVDFTGIAGEIYDAFKLGRAAIVAKDYTLRDQQANIIREKISEIIGIRAVYYLVQGKNFLNTNKGAAFHDLSEGYGFIYSLQFTRKPNTNEPYFTKAEVEAYLATLTSGNGFWDITATELDDMAASIAARFNFTVAEAGN